jgi:para-nitrobenzyl esterase
MKALSGWLGAIWLVACHTGIPATHDLGSSSSPDLADYTGGDPTSVTVKGGVLRCATEGATVSCRAIPYAAAPVGDLRWRPPAAAPSWTGERDATAFGNKCLQPDPTGTQVVGDEDCLFLNVWTPLPRLSPTLPVIVFLHGGDWIKGAGSLPLYDSSLIAMRAAAVVVTVNYRLGALGFLAHSALTAEDPNHSTGNYGLVDQTAALTWVRDNIAAFGGDPTRVLLWGQSAGGWSTLMHIASPVLGRDLFSRAFSESGGTGARPLAGSQTHGASYAAALGCSGPDALVCLRALAGPQVALPAIAPATWGPVIDGYIFTEPVMTTIVAGRQAHKPLVIGTTALEYGSAGLPVTPPVSSVMTATDYHNALMQLFGASVASAILQRYPEASFASPQAAYLAVLDDWGMLCQTRRIARAIASSQAEPVFRYLFSHVDSAGPFASSGPVHAADLGYWFSTWKWTTTAGENALGQAMGAAISRFAAAGDPNEAGSQAWLRYDQSDPYLDFADTPAAAAGLHSGLCDFWDMTAPHQ